VRCPTKGLHDSIVHVFGLGIPDAREDGLARLMRQQPKAPDRGAAHQVNSVSEQAEALGGSFDEQMVSNRTGFIALAQTSHGEDYEGPASRRAPGLKARRTSTMRSSGWSSSGASY